MFLSMNTIPDLEKLYASLGERDYEAVMSHLANDIVWIVADNSPFADRSPYQGIADVRSGIFDRLTAGFDKLVVAVDEIFECEGRKVVVLGYYHGRFRGRAEEFKAQSLTSGQSAKDGPLSSSNISTRCRSHATCTLRGDSRNEHTIVGRRHSDLRIHGPITRTSSTSATQAWSRTQKVGVLPWHMERGERD